MKLVLSREGIKEFPEYITKELLPIFEEKQVEEITLSDVLSTAPKSAVLFYLQDQCKLSKIEKIMIQTALKINEDCDSYYHCYSIFNCHQISNSHECNDSNGIFHSFLISDSNFIFRSMDISHSLICSDSETVVSSAVIHNCSAIHDSRLVFDSIDIRNSFAIFNCEDMENSYFNKNCKHGFKYFFCEGLNEGRNRIFCTQDFSADYGVFNSPVSQNLFDYYWKQLTELFLNDDFYNICLQILFPVAHAYFDLAGQISFTHIYEAIDANLDVNNDYTLSKILENRSKWQKITEIIPDFRTNRQLAYFITLSKYALLDN